MENNEFNDDQTVDFLAQFGRIKTPEEIKKEKEEYYFVVFSKKILVSILKLQGK